MTATVLKAKMLKFPQIKPNVKQRIVSAKDRPQDEQQQPRNGQN